MAAIKRIQRATIDGWHKLDIGDNFGMYLIAIKDAKTEDDVMDIDELRSVVIELGIDSGITDMPIPIQRINLKFADYSIEGKGTLKSALGMTCKLPKEDTYIRVVAFSNNLTEKLTGSMPVSINTVII